MLIHTHKVHPEGALLETSYPEKEDGENSELKAQPLHFNQTEQAMGLKIWT